MTDTANNIYGNCWAACLASILELDIADVPEFDAGDPDDLDGTWARKTNRWLAQFGLAFLEYPSLPPESYLAMGMSVYHIITGPSPRNSGMHAVVGLNGKIVHDPHPSRAGLASGPWLHSVLVRTNMPPTEKVPKCQTMK